MSSYWIYCRPEEYLEKIKREQKEKTMTEKFELRKTYFNANAVKVIYVGFDKEKGRHAFLLKDRTDLHNLDYLFFEGFDEYGQRSYSYLGNIFTTKTVKRKWYQIWLPKSYDIYVEVL